MKIKIVSDSSANICSHVTQPISYVPLRIVTDEKEYVDTIALDVPRMLQELKEYQGRSGTACPGVQDSYNPEAADRLAEMIYEEYPDADISITCNRGLCCYYAEKGSVLVGFEDILV